MIGEAHLRREADGKLKSYVAGQPKVYAIFKNCPSRAMSTSRSPTPPGIRLTRA